MDVINKSVLVLSRDFCKVAFSEGGSDSPHIQSSQVFILFLVNLNFSKLSNTHKKDVFGFLSKPPQDIQKSKTPQGTRKWCFELEKSREGRKSKTFSTLFRPRNSRPRHSYLSMLSTNAYRNRQEEKFEKVWNCFLISCGVFVRNPDNYCCSCVC